MPRIDAETLREQARHMIERQRLAEAAPSVIDPYHPANARNNHEGGDGTYTFRQRNIKLNFTLGWELEANHVPTRIPVGVEHISDGSVDGDGAEFVVLPAVTRSPRYVLGLLKDLVHAPRLNTNKSCGFHIHVSASNLASVARMRQWAIGTEHLALQVEDLAFKAVPDARQSNEYCRRIVPIASGHSFSAHKYNNSRRYHWLNTVEMFRPNGIRTIEVRLLGNTHRWKYLLAWTLFSMELARRGWEVANKPFDVAVHVNALGLMLKKIAKEIKPLDKKLEPVPQWVYDGLETFGIEAATWDRPLARLTETETTLQGLAPRFYSDNQEIIETRRNEDDEDNNPCGCGCGEDGACTDYLHDNGDCDSAYCYQCHANGDCAGLPSCDHCIDRAHDNRENCQRTRCSACHPTPRVRPVTTPSVTSIVDGAHTGRVTVNSEIEPVQAEIDALHNTRVDNVTLQMSAYTLIDREMSQMVHDSIMYGQSVGQVLIDEAAQTAPVTGTEINGRLWISSTPTIDQIDLMLPPDERRANHMLDPHEHALSADREHYIGRTRLTVAEIESLNRRNEERLRGNR